MSTQTKPFSNPPAAHTPGPWVVEDAGGWVRPFRLTTDHDKPGQEEKLIASFPLMYPDKDMGSSERRANARLIAAAPELLAALRRVAEVVLDSGDDISNPDFYAAEHAQIRAAIAKAQGGAL